MNKSMHEIFNEVYPGKTPQYWAKNISVVQNTEKTKAAISEAVQKLMEDCFELKVLPVFSVIHDENGCVLVALIPKD